MRAAALLALLLAPVLHAEDAVLTEEITIKGKRAPGPAAWSPPPVVDKPVLDEVAASLSILRDDHRKAAPKIPLPVLQSRLARPFPARPFLVFSPRSLKKNCESWVFQVFEGKALLWSDQADGKPPKQLQWDGRDLAGNMAVRVGGGYHFRFSCREKKETLSLESEAVRIDSLRYQENMGDIVLEAALPLLFAKNKAVLLESSGEYLTTMAGWMAGKGGKNSDFRFDLYQEGPDSRLATARATALVDYFSAYLVINRDKIVVKTWSIRERGEALTCSLGSASDAVIKTR